MQTVRKREREIEIEREREEWMRKIERQGYRERQTDKESER